MKSGSRYAAADAPPSYSHRFHAGNVGDVWKHCALVEVLRRIVAAAGGRTSRSSVHYVETHAGEGRYPLGATGEWTEGIGRLWTPAKRDEHTRSERARCADDDAGSANDGQAAVARYAALCRELTSGAARPETYPGSPLFARAVLGPGATLTLAERDPEACRHLRATFVGDAHVEIVEGDGLALVAPRREPRNDPQWRTIHDATIVLIDPPWTQKADWIAVPDALVAANRALPSATLVLWYPVKSLTRPNAMHARLEAAGVSAAIAEVVTTSLKHQRHRLNGSGVLLVRPPVGAVETLAAAASVIGARCATRAGAWWLRMQAW